MKLTKSALKSPAAVAVGVTMIFLVGVISLLDLPIQLFPDIERPRIAIQTQWRSASPAEIESEIVEPQEQVLRGLPGMTSMNVFANRGNAFVNLEFSVGTNMEQTLIEVISRMTRIPPLPRDATPPRIMLGGFGGGTPALTFFFLQALPGNEKPVQEYIDYVDNTIRPRIEAIQGVASVETFNRNSQEELQIRFDPVKAAQLGIAIPNLVNLVAGSSDVSGGFVDVGRRQYTLRFSGKYQSEQLKNLILENRNGRQIRLADIAEVKISRNDVSNTAYQNGNPAFSLRINKANGANTLATLNRVKAEIEAINQQELLPKKLVMVQSFDASVFIYRAINLVTSNLFAGIVLSLSILWIFVRRARATLIIATAIPISILSTFFVLDALGRSLNVISLAGLAFAVGMVLDAAIVVLENILRMREKGKDNHQASEQGALQVWPALLASTTTTVAIFLPVFFLKDVEGQLFGDLALTIAIAVTVSLLVAVILLPVLAKFLIKEQKVSDPNKKLWQSISKLVLQLTSTPKKRFAIAGTMLLLPVVLTWLLTPTMDYLPPVKRDAVDANLQFPPGANVKTIDEEVVQTIIKRLDPYMKGEKQPALKNYYIFTGPFGGNLGVRAKDQSQVNELLNIVRNEILVDLPDTSAFAFQGNLFGGFGGGRSVQIHLQSKDYELLQASAEKGLAWVREAIPGVNVNANPGLQSAEPELRLLPKDREIIEQGWSRREVGILTRALGDGMFVGEHFDGNKRMNIILRATEWSSPEALAAIPVLTGSGNVKPFSDLVDIERAVGPSRLRRLDGQRTITLNVNPPQGWSLEQTISVLRANVHQKLQDALPADATIQYGGSADQLSKAISTMGQNFAFALVILFLLLAALFKSIKDSFLVLITIPLATVGGILALQILNMFTFQPLDLLTMIGFVILLGLVVNNAILLVHQTRSAETCGQKRREAIQEALQLRLRPIFMSTLTSFFGMLPLLLMPGAGSVIYRGLASVIVGGLAVSTVFTILLLPCLLRIKRADFSSIIGIKPNNHSRPNSAHSAASISSN